MTPHARLGASFLGNAWLRASIGPLGIARIILRNGRRINVAWLPCIRMGLPIVSNTG
jgi:hypothetical protein